MYWVGRGVLRINGKDYYTGEEVPVDTLTKEKIAALKKSKELVNNPIQVVKPKVKYESPKK